MSEEWDFGQMDKAELVSYAIYGAKGVGKTTLAMGLYPEARVDVINFDYKAPRVKEGVFKNTERISVYDGARYLSEDDMVRTGDKTVEYLLALVRRMQAVAETDVLVIDPFSTLVECAEARMRKELGVSFIKGVDYSQWKLRKFVLRKLHHEFLKAAKLAVIYVTDEEYGEEKQDFVVKKSTPRPRWMDIVTEQTDIVIRVYVEEREREQKRFAWIESSKVDKPHTWETYDLTSSFKLDQLVEKGKEEPW